MSPRTHTIAAIAGTGFMARVHLEALRRLGVQVKGILGSTPDKSAAAARDLGLPRGYASYEELLADGVEAVHITTPNHLHQTMVKAALAAGKHVMCEKPLATSAEHTRELCAQAARAGVVSAVNYNIRFYPLCVEAQARVGRGDLGKVHAVVGRYVQDWLLYDTDHNWRVGADRSGPLRAVADIGTHWLDLVQTITGLRVVELCADLHTVLPQRLRPRSGDVQTFAGKPNSGDDQESVAIDTEDQAAILLRLSNGARGTLWVSQMSAGRKNHLSYEISGAKAALAWASERPDELWIGHRDRPNEVLMRDPSLETPHARAITELPGGHAEGFAGTFKQCFAAFYGQIAGTRSGGPAPATFTDGHRELLLCEAVLKSHHERRWITVAGEEPQ